MSKYDNRQLDGRHDWRQPIPPITGWEWYNPEEWMSSFTWEGWTKDGNNLTGTEYSAAKAEWFLYRKWLRENRPNEWAEQRKNQIEKLAATVASMGLHDVNKVQGKNGCREMTPTEVKGRKVPSLRFDQVDCTQLEQNVELFEKLLEATRTMTNDEHCEAFKRLQQTIE